jgi:hypothetical protein
MQEAIYTLDRTHTGGALEGLSFPQLLLSPTLGTPQVGPTQVSPV